MTLKQDNQAQLFSQVIQLYEFALAVGTSTDLEQNCRTFFDRILARRNLSYAALWMADDAGQDQTGFTLTYSDPRNEYPGPDRIPPTMALAEEIKKRQIFSSLREELVECAWFPDDYIPRGESFTFVNLQQTGFIVFAGYGKRGVWQPWQLNQMRPIFNSFNASIKSCLLFDRLQVEIGERKIAESKARQANRVKSDFVANMSHELRTPLNAVLGMSQLLNETTLSQEQRELVDTILNSGESLLGLINSILDFTKLEAHKVKLENIAFEPRAIASVIEKTFISECHAKGLAFTVEVDDAIPRRLLGDPLRVKQILLNLSSNAVKFTSSGGIHVAMRLLSRSDDQATIEFAVKDSGIGIREDHLGELFESFHQVDSSITRKFGGTGLGLAISKQLALLMGGGIRVESTPGSGSEFIVHLRLGVATNDHPDVHVTGEIKAISMQSGRARILVVEDNPVNQLVASKLLKSLQCDSDISPSGSDALERLRRQDYDLVLMDMQMPEMDGVETTRLIRSGDSGVRNPEIHIIAMTANVSASDKQQCMDAGMDDFLSKPVRKSVLAKKLNAVLNI